MAKAKKKQKVDKKAIDELMQKAREQRMAQESRAPQVQQEKKPHKIVEMRNLVTDQSYMPGMGVRDFSGAQMKVVKKVWYEAFVLAPTGEVFIHYEDGTMDMFVNAPFVARIEYVADESEVPPQGPQVEEDKTEQPEMPAPVMPQSQEGVEEGRPFGEEEVAQEEEVTSVEELDRDFPPAAEGAVES